MFHLINPLLGPNCFVGSADNPILVNPELNGTLVQEMDPNPQSHPDTSVLKIKNAIATDSDLHRARRYRLRPGRLGEHRDRRGN